MQKYQEGDWYIFEEKTTKPFERFRIDATRDLMQGLASTCAFAFVLMTPDDKTASEDEVESKWRARQNVIMELG